jgi:ADP-heptose:LPS heptosyltransferase
MALDNPAPSREKVIPRVFLADDDRQRATELLQQLRIGRKLAVLHPYSVHRMKRWPEASWRSLALLLEDHGWEWVVIGSEEDQFMRPLAGTRDLSAMTDLRTTCAILARADVLVSGDSGPIHLASAVGTPVVALFGPTSREWGFYPVGTGTRVMERTLACRPCSLHGIDSCDREEECLRSIRPKEVLEEIMAVSS